MTKVSIAIVIASLFSMPVEAQTRRTRRPNRVIRLGEVVVEGQIQKPQAFYILQRSSLNFEGLELKSSFVPKIIESVKGPPF